jgi:hypothetical protein
MAIDYKKWSLGYFLCPLKNYGVLEKYIRGIFLENNFNPIIIEI